MIQKFNDINIRFTIADTMFQTLNLICEEFQRTIPTHAHGSGSYELHYISKGRGRALINGKHYPLIPGTLYITGPHVEHAQSPLPEDPMLEYCIYLKITQKRRTASSYPESESEILNSFKKTDFWYGQDSQYAGEIILELFREITEKKKGWQMQAEALLKQMLIYLIRNYDQNELALPPSHTGLSDKTAVIIEDYFLYQYQNLSLEELANQLGLSTRQTERLLQKQYGKTFLRKKTEAKMSAASTLLSETSQSITSIAEALGYSSIEHFSSAFKKYYHCSPRQYRQKTEQQLSSF